MMLILKTSVAALLFSFLLAACNKQVPRTVHEGPVDTRLSAIQREIPASEAALMAVDLNAIYGELTNDVSPEGKRKILKELEPFVLNKNYVEDPRYVGLPRLRTMLSYYNHALLDLTQSKPDIVESEGLLKSYIALALSGCDANLKECLNFDFFRSDYRSAQILLIHVEKLDKEIEKSKTIVDGRPTCDTACFASVRDYYRLLSYALDLKNGIKDAKMEFLYLNHARDYADYFVSLGHDATEHDLLQRHGSVFQTIIENYPADPGNPQFQKFVANFKPWGYSHLNPDPFPFGTKRMFTYAAGNYLYSKNKDGTHGLNPDFVQEITKSKKEFTKLLDSLLSKNKKILQALGLDEGILKGDAYFSEYFFMIDRLYKGHLTGDEVSEVWQGSDKDQKRLLSTLESYVKVQLISMISDTNSQMSKIYANKEFESDTMLKMVLEGGFDLSVSWNTMLKRLDGLAIFIEGSPRSSSGDRNTLEQSLLMLKSVQRNIKYLAVYPNMMLLVYFMSQAKAPLIFHTFWGQEIKIDSTTIFNLFFAGGIPEVWFQFGNDSIPFNKFDLLYAFHFAVITGTFETFGAKRDAGGKADVDHSKYFKELMKQYPAVERNALIDAIRKLQERLAGSSDFSDARAACANPDHVISMEWEDLRTRAYAGNGSGGVSAALQDFYGGFYAPAAQIPKIRVDLDTKLIQIRVMIDILQHDFPLVALPDPEKSKMITDIEQGIKEIEDLKKTYFTLAMQLHRESSKCENLLVKKEHDFQIQLYEKEYEHLAKVYAAIKQFQMADGKLDRAQLAANLNTPKINQNPEFGFSPDLDTITTEGYRYTRMDLYYRMQRRLAQMHPAVIVKPPVQATKLDYYGQDTWIRFVDSQGRLVPKEQFIKIGLQKLNGYDKAYLDWTKETTTLEPKISKLRSMIALYKMGFSLKDVSDRVSAEEIIAEVFDLIKYLSLTADDIKILNWLGIDHKSSRYELRRYFLQDNTDEQLSLFELAFDVVADSATLLKDARDFASTVRNVSFFLFPDPKVDAVMRKYYRPIVMGEEAILRDFDRAIRATEAAASQTPAKDLTFAYELSNGQPVYYDLQFNGNTPLYLSPTRRWAYEGTMREFHQGQTGGYFKTKPGDPECEDSKTKVAACDDQKAGK